MLDVQPNQVSLPAQTNQKKFNWKNVALIALLGATLILAATFTYYFLRLRDTNIPSQPTELKTTTLPDKSATPSAEKDETSDWNTYSNSQLGFSLKLPKDWLSGQCGDKLVFLSPNKELLGLCQSEFGGVINIEKEINNYEDSLSTLESDKSLKSTDIKLGGKDALKFTDKLNGGDYIVYLLNDSGKAFHILYHRSNPEWDDFSSTFEKIISTFKFLD